MKLSIRNRLRVLMTGSVDNYATRFLRGDDMTSGVINVDTAMKYSAVNACIRVLSETYASAPILLYQKTKDGREPVTDHQLYDILHNRPNEEMAPFNFNETQMANFSGSGNTVCKRLFNQSGELVGLYPYPQSIVQIKRNQETKRLEYVIRSGNEQETLTRNQVFHVANLSFDGVIGLSPIAYAASSIRLGLSYEDYGINFYRNAAMPSGVFEHPGGLTDLAYARLKKDLSENYQGLKNTGTPMVLEEGMKWNQVTINPIDAQLLESKYFQIEDICRIYRVPQHLVNKLDRSTFCLPADVEVLTEHGPKSIADVRVGELVYSVAEAGVKLSPVIKSVCSGEDGILEIKTTNRTIRANAAHRIAVRREYTATPKTIGKPYVYWQTEFVPAGELREGDTIVTFDGAPKRIKTDCPTRELTEGFMEFCGLLLGDGNIHKQAGRPSHVSIARSGTASYMDHYREVMKAEFKCYAGGNGRGDKSCVPLKSVCLTEGKRSTRFASALAAQELTNLGLAGNAWTKKVPDWVFTLAENLQLAFLRGFLDADGTVDKNGRIAYHSVNFEMLSQMRHLCMMLGVPVTNIRNRKSKVALPNGQPYMASIWTFTCSDPGNNIRIWSNDCRYQERLKSGKPFNKKGRDYPRFGGRDFDIPGCSLARITSIKQQPAELVYDLEVEGAHTFIANGVVVHNSNIEHLSLEFIMYTMLPHYKRFEDNINMQLLPAADRRKGLYFEYKLDGLLRGDAKSRADAYAVGRQWGWLSVNDIRKLENMPPIPNGDIYIEPLNYREAGKPDQQVNAYNRLVEDIHKMIEERR